MNHTKFSSRTDGLELAGRVALLRDTVQSAATRGDRLCRDGEANGATMLLLTEASYALHRAVVALSEAEASASHGVRSSRMAFVPDDRDGSGATRPGAVPAT